MPDDQAKIIVGASPVGIDQRHTYLLFERSDGTRTVVRGGPDQRAEGNDLANLAGSTLLGSENFGNIRFDSGPYVPPYAAVYQKRPGGPDRPLPLDQADPNDPSLRKDDDGNIEARLEVAHDWPLPGEKHERAVLWRGTDRELEEKLSSALTAGQQINDAKLEYSPLYNNSNGVTGLMLKAAGVKPSLPLDKDGHPVDAPNFGEPLYQDVGLASNRSGYSFDGKQWHDDNDRKIKPPHSGEPVVPLDPVDKAKPRSGSFDVSDNAQPGGIQKNNHAFSTGDPDLDRLAAATFSGNDAAMSQVNAQIGQSPTVHAYEQWGRDLVAIEQRHEMQQQAMAVQVRGPAMTH